MSLKIQVGKRAHNKATMKLEILTAFLKEMETAKLSELNIEEVCKKIGISKVTFFNYFGSKEEVVEYFIQLWQYEMNYELIERKLSGQNAIRFLFNNVSEHPSASSIMSALISFFLKVDCYEPTTVTDYELYIYNEQAYLKGYRSKQLYAIVSQAIREMNVGEEESRSIMNNIISGFYGIPFIINLGFGKDLKGMYQQYLNTFLPKEANYE